MKTLFNLSLLILILTIPRCQDSGVSQEIESQLKESPTKLGLTYPNSVKRFYAEKKFQSIWFQNHSKPTKTWESMLLLDCVLQYGLSKDDYHQGELLYPKLREMMNDPKKVIAKDKARFEIVLTDALLTFINDMHFGMANPIFSRAKIDNGNIDSFNAETVLANAFEAKDFMSALLKVQPKSSAYADLQKHMVLIRGQYLDGSYSVPEADVRKVAINMERLKWQDITAKTFIQINIPAYTLKLYLPDTSFEFRAIVGKPSHQTPLVASSMTYFRTAPDWKVPPEMFENTLIPKVMADIGFLEQNHYTIYDLKGNLIKIDLTTLAKIKKAPKEYTARQSSDCEPSLGRIAFHFSNSAGIYLYDGQQHGLFNFEQRAFTNGCVSVQAADKLAALLLKYDGQGRRTDEMIWAMKAYANRTFMLQKVLPISIVYQTCAIRDGKLVTYADIYNRDIELENNMYRNDVMLAKN